MCYSTLAQGLHGANLLLHHETKYIILSPESSVAYRPDLRGQGSGWVGERNIKKCGVCFIVLKAKARKGRLLKGV